MKKKLITACVMPFLAACGQNSSDIFTINDGQINGLHAPWDGLDDDTKFRCSTDDSLFKFSFEVNDSTLTLEPEYKDKMSVIYEDRVEIFFSPDTLMSHYYGAEMDPAGRVLDYQAEYYRKFDYTWGFKTLKYTGDITERTSGTGAAPGRRILYGRVPRGLSQRRVCELVFRSHH